MTKEFTTRPYEKGDEDGIVELLKLSFPDWAARKKPLEYWNWKYRDSPLGSSISIALSNEQVIGVGHEINLNIKVGPRIFRSQYGDDYATHPDFRGMRVYKSLVNELYERRGKQIEFVFGLSTNPIVINYFLKNIRPTKFNFPYVIRHPIRIKDVSMHVEAKITKNKAIIKSGLSLHKALYKANNKTSRKSTVSKDITIIEPSDFSETYDDFWGQIKDRHNFIIEKSAKFLNWRYKDPRGGSYVVREARNGDKLLGFIVLQVRKTKDYPEGYIMDIATLSEDPEVYNALLEDACNYFDDRGLNAINLQIVDGHPLQTYAKSYGYIEPPGTTKTYIGCEMIRGFDKERKILQSSTPSQLHFCYGDYY